MTDKNKQIQELREDISKVRRWFFEDDANESLDEYIANDLYTKGYRKASDVAREIFAEIEESIDTYGDEYGIMLTIDEKKLIELKKKYESEGEK